MYPAFLRLAGRRVVLVGGGRVAAGKLHGLMAEGAQVTVVAPEIRPELEQPGVAIVRRGVIKSNESVVVCITGNGYKTAEVMQDRVERPTQIGRSLADFERVVAPQTVSA